MFNSVFNRRNFSLPHQPFQEGSPCKTHIRTVPAQLEFIRAKRNVQTHIKYLQRNAFFEKQKIGSDNY